MEEEEEEKIIEGSCTKVLTLKTIYAMIFYIFSRRKSNYNKKKLFFFILLNNRCANLTGCNIAGMEIWNSL